MRTTAMNEWQAYVENAESLRRTVLAQVRVDLSHCPHVMKTSRNECYHGVCANFVHGVNSLLVIRSMLG